MNSRLVQPTGTNGARFHDHTLSLQAPGLGYTLLLEIIGNCSMTEVDHSTARAYKQTLLKLPANINKATDYKDKSLEDILAMDSITPMATSTVNKHLTRAASLFEWAVKHGYVDTNYFAGLTLKKTNRASEERAAFTRDDTVNRATSMRRPSGRCFHCANPVSRRSELRPLPRPR